MSTTSLDAYIQRDYRYLLQHAQYTLASTSVELSATGILHETYLRLRANAQTSISDRGHFRALARRVMRHVAIDVARQQQSQKRGGHLTRTPLHPLFTAAWADDGTHLPELAEALMALRQHYPRHAQLVEWRFFDGFSMVEITQMAGVSRRTTQRMWDTARQALHGYLTAA